MIYFKLSRSVMAMIAVAFLGTTAAQANSLGENAAWQFNSSADKVNKAYLEEMRQKKLNGQYSAPVFTTNIDKQFNCNLTASATGNLGTNGMSNGGPSASGNLANATGNDSTTDVNKNTIGDTNLSLDSELSDGMNRRYWNGFGWVNHSGSLNGSDIISEVAQGQTNQGPISASTVGDVSSVMRDSHNYQALNSSQDNTGNQQAGVESSNACSFASVN